MISRELVAAAKALSAQCDPVPLGGRWVDFASDALRRIPTRIAFKPDFRRLLDAICPETSAKVMLVHAHPVMLGPDLAAAIIATVTATCPAQNTRNEIEIHLAPGALCWAKTNECFSVRVGGQGSVFVGAPRVKRDPQTPTLEPTVRVSLHIIKGPTGSHVVIVELCKMDLASWCLGRLKCLEDRPDEDIKQLVEPLLALAHREFVVCLRVQTKFLSASSPPVRLMDVVRMLKMGAEMKEVRRFVSETNMSFNCDNMSVARQGCEEHLLLVMDERGGLHLAMRTENVGTGADGGPLKRTNVDLILQHSLVGNNAEITLLMIQQSVLNCLQDHIEIVVLD